MCGLTGILNAGARSTADLPGIVSAMTACLRHRGPDAEGIWADEGIALGHRRLSILDLSPAGSQPMHSACGRYVIAFNGEIYNHLELRRCLAESSAAPEWRGHSDTETLLAAIAHWGLSETLTRAAGMFALGLWDKKAGRLSLARDRMGEKPLYWGWAGTSLVFGSELKAIRQHPDFSPEICRVALGQYLRFGFVPAPWSIYSGIYKLEPGSILEVDSAPPSTPPALPLRPEQSSGSLSIRRYWSLNETIARGGRDLLTDEHEAVAALDETLSGAVRRQMLSDVPLGAFLSGGLDSSLIVALMQRNSVRPVRTFTVAFENVDFNEAPYAAQIAKHLGSAHTELTVTEKEAQDSIPRLPELYDEPFADYSQIPTYIVCGAARSSVTVALTGDGGDELLGGYYRHFWAPEVWRRLQWMPRAMRHMLGRGLASVPVETWDWMGATTIASIRHPGDRAHKLAARLRDVDNFDDLYLSLMHQWPAGELLEADLDQGTSVLDDPLPGHLADDPVGRMMVQDLRSYLPDDILCKVDRAAMGVSLETRVPFLDPEVVALSARLPRSMKIRDGQGKWALRQVVDRYVPRNLIDRPKAGFGIPVGEWIRGPLKSWAEDLLSAEALARHGLVNPASVTKVWAEHLSGRRDWTSRLWIILMLQMWLNG